MPAAKDPPPQQGSITEREVAAYWDQNADSWSPRVRGGIDVYREFYNNPAILEFIGDVAGQRVLDAGCGEGHNTRILARRGARMTGVDLSARMIEHARAEERREPLGIRYEVASFSDLALLDAGAFDAAASFMALMDGPDFAGAMREIYRVLKPRGRLTFSILHPCFATKGFTWLHDEQGVENGIRVAAYFDSTPWVERWKFSGAPDAPDAEMFAVPRFDRTLSEYVNGILDAGFSLERIHEPRPSEQACSEHPFLRKWREHAPLFLYFRAVRR